jgi:hypothetical protein
MFAVARQQRIKELLLKHKQMDVTTSSHPRSYRGHCAP